MFSLVSGVYNAYLAPQKLNLLMVGAQGVGKTTLLERTKVTHFPKRSSSRVAVTSQAATLPADIFRGQKADTSTTTAVVKMNQVSIQQQQQKSSSLRRLSRYCPAPPRYAKASEQDEDDDPPEQQPLQVTLPSPSSELQRQQSSAVESLESVELNRHSSRSIKSDDPSAPQTEYDLKPKAKMLPLEKIRPTIGMNLGKVDICGTKCHVWDLGGRLRDLWERYYDDCDAVLFVWRLFEDADTSNNNSDDSDDDDDSNVQALTPESQEQLLNQVRQAIPDDVPLVVLVHFCSDLPSGTCTDQRYQTAPYLLSHYHNPLQGVFLVNARTGQGVRTALEWLIPLAKQQQRLREARNAAAAVDVEKAG